MSKRHALLSGNTLSALTEVDNTHVLNTRLKSKIWYYSKMDSAGGRCYDNARCESVIIMEGGDVLQS